MTNLSLKLNSNISWPLKIKGSQWFGVVFIGLILIGLGVAGDRLFGKKVVTTSRYQITSVQIMSEDGAQLIGTVLKENGQLVFVCQHETLCAPLDEYFAKIIPDLMTNGAKFEVGECDSDGCWDGMQTVYLSDDEFLNGVYATVYDDLNQEYDVEVTKQIVEE